MNGFTGGAIGRDWGKEINPPEQLIQTGLEFSSGQQPFSFFIDPAVMDMEGEQEAKAADSKGGPWPALQQAAMLEMLSLTASSLSIIPEKRSGTRRWNRRRLRKLQSRRKRQWNSTH